MAQAAGALLIAINLQWAFPKWPSSHALEAWDLSFITATKIKKPGADAARAHVVSFNFANRLICKSPSSATKPSHSTGSLRQDVMAVTV